MVPDIRESHSGGNSAGSSQSAEKRGFANAITPAALEHVACAIMLGQIERIIRVIPDAVSHGVIELHRFCDGVFLAFSDRHPCELDDGFMVIVNDGCRQEIDAVSGLLHGGSFISPMPSIGTGSLHIDH
jgi:hypothetical protein